MNLSKLQRFALIESYTRRGVRLSRTAIHRFYASSPSQPERIQDVVTKSLESLIDRGLMIGFGRRTPKKWFIEDIKLTARGRREARTLLGQQLSLPLRRSKRAA